MKDGKLFNFLKKLGKPVGGLLNLAGDLTGIDAIEKIGDAISGSPDLSPEEKAQALKLLSLDVQDRADARSSQVQVATSSNSTWLAKNFIYLLASFWSITASTYFALVTFTDVTNKDASQTILGFLLGTAVSSIIAFFFGSSEGSKTKDQLLGKK